VVGRRATELPARPARVRPSERRIRHLCLGRLQRPVVPPAPAGRRPAARRGVPPQPGLLRWYATGTSSGPPSSSDGPKDTSAKRRSCPVLGAREPRPPRRLNARPPLTIGSQAGTRRRDPSARRRSGFRTRTSPRSSTARPLAPCRCCQPYLRGWQRGRAMSPLARAPSRNARVPGRWPWRPARESFAPVFAGLLALGGPWPAGAASW
jgi:hypothetical protein